MFTKVSEVERGLHAGGLAVEAALPLDSVAKGKTVLGNFTTAWALRRNAAVNLHRIAGQAAVGDASASSPELLEIANFDHDLQELSTQDLAAVEVVYHRELASLNRLIDRGQNADGQKKSLVAMYKKYAYEQLIALKRLQSYLPVKLEDGNDYQALRALNQYCGAYVVADPEGRQGLLDGSDVNIVKKYMEQVFIEHHRVGADQFKSEYLDTPAVLNAKGNGFKLEHLSRKMSEDEINDLAAEILKQSQIDPEWKSVTLKGFEGPTMMQLAERLAFISQGAIHIKCEGPRIARVAKKIMHDMFMLHGSDPMYAVTVEDPRYDKQQTDNITIVTRILAANVGKPKEAFEAVVNEAKQNKELFSSYLTIIGGGDQNVGINIVKALRDREYGNDPAKQASFSQLCDDLTKTTQQKWLVPTTNWNKTPPATVTVGQQQQQAAQANANPALALQAPAPVAAQPVT